MKRILLNITLACLSAFLLINTVHNTALSKSYKEKLEFDWEAVKGASSYEVVIEEAIAGSWKKSLTQVTVKPVFEGELLPGTYRFRLRTLDKRKVGGEWSDYSEFKLLWPKVNMEVLDHKKVYGLDSVVLKNKTKGQLKIKWDFHSKVKSYNLEVLNKNTGKLMTLKNINKRSMTVAVIAGETYSLRVIAKDLAGTQGSKNTYKEIKVLGKIHEAAQLIKPQGLYPKKVEISNHEVGNVYLYNLFYKSVFSTEFSELEKSRSSKEKVIALGTKPGLYKIELVTTSNLRAPSIKKTYLIQVGDESLGLSYKELLALAIAKGNMKFSVWGEIRTSIFKYKNFSSTTSVTTEFESQTAGTRFGAYYKLSDDYGVEMHATFDGIEFENETKNYSTLSLYGIIGKSVDLESEYKYGVGLRFSSLPVIFAFPLEGYDIIHEEVDFTGLSFRGEYSFLLYDELSARVEGYLWIPFGDPETESLTEISNSGIFLQGKGFYAVDANTVILLGLGIQVETTQYTEDLGDFSVFDPNESFAEVQQLHLSFGYQQIF